MATKFNFKKTSHHFYEKQPIRNVPLLALVLATEVVLGYFILQVVLDDNLWGVNKMRGWSLIIFALAIPTPILLMFIVVKLNTFISEDGIFYKWIPFRRSFTMVQWEGIRELIIIDLKNKGGWWKMRQRYSAVNLPGNRYGILITMKSGRQLLIGTRRSEELHGILKRLGREKYLAQQSETLFNYD